MLVCFSSSAQGLTCDNIMVDLSRAFTYSMAYVALSRVRSLKGLHLIDFHPGSIYVDPKCIEEYNRLRAASELQDLPQITDYNRQPSLAKMFRRPMRTVEGFVDEISKDFDVRIDKGKAPVAKPTRKRENVDEPTEAPPAKVTRRETKCPFPSFLLANPSATNCFFNAVAQLLRALPETNNYLRWIARLLEPLDFVMPNDSSMRLLVDLGRLFRKEGRAGKSTVAQLRGMNYFPAHMRHGQQDAVEMLETIIGSARDATAELEPVIELLTESSHLPELNSMEYDRHTEVWCGVCKKLSREYAEQDAIVRIRLHSGVNDVEQLLAEQYPVAGLTNETDQDYRSTREKWDFSGTRHLFVRPDVFDPFTQVRRNDLSLQQNSRLLDFHGRKWELVATIVHLGDTPNAGHYYTLLRSPDEYAWWRFEDDKKVEKCAFDTNDLARNVLLVYKGVNDAPGLGPIPVVRTEVTPVARESTKGRSGRKSTQTTQQTSTLETLAGDTAMDTSFSARQTQEEALEFADAVDWVEFDERLENEYELYLDGLEDYRKEMSGEYDIAIPENACTSGQSAESTKEERRASTEMAALIPESNSEPSYFHDIISALNKLVRDHERLPEALRAAAATVRRRASNAVQYRSSHWSTDYWYPFEWSSWADLVSWIVGCTKQKMWNNLQLGRATSLEKDLKIASPSLVESQSTSKANDGDAIEPEDLMRPKAPDVQRLPCPDLPEITYSGPSPQPTTNVNAGPAPSEVAEPPVSPRCPTLFEIREQLLQEYGQRIWDDEKAKKAVKRRLQELGITEPLTVEEVMNPW